MFGRKDSKDSSQSPVSPGPSADHPARPGAKNRPTPSRREAQAARVQPLVPADRKAAEQASKEKDREQRRRQRAAMNAGEQWALLPRDRGEDKAFMRDWIDARWNIGEYLLPAMLIGMPMSLLANAQLTIAGLTLIYGIFAAAIVDFVVMWFRLRSRVEAKFGSRSKGAAFQMFSRYVQLRPTRVPRARVKRGQYPS